MPVHNADIAGMLSRLADLLEIEGANRFRVRAYRTAARAIEGLPHSVATLVEEEKDLTELPGIGEDLAAKLKEIVETGHLPLLDEVTARTPGELADLANLPGLGPKRVKILYDQLHIQTLEDLAQAAQAGKVRELAGFGKKTEDKILVELGRRRESEQRIKLMAAEEIAEPLLAQLTRAGGVKQAVIAGSYRRRRETVRDLDILVTCAKSDEVMKRFVTYEDVDQIVSQGTTRSTVVLRSGVHVDLRVVPDQSYGAALQYFTGSKAHNIAIRTRAVKRGLKVNEYGVFRGEKVLAGRTEEEIYAAVGLPFIEPELRENWGEIEAATRKRLPRLVTRADLRGDLHCHTKASDGHATIEQTAKAARDLGYDYVAISDHTQRVRVAHGLDAKRFAKHLEDIERVNERLDGITVLKSAEVDILEDGALDLPDEILKKLDLTVCAIHFKFNLSRAKQTERVIRAMDSPHFTILAHPTGRLLNEREPYEVDLERVMHAARERGCFLEVNAQPVRLDLSDVHCKMAKDIGVKVAVSTDAHSTTDLEFIRFGLDQARRGWLEREDVLNTRKWADVKKLIKRK